MKKAFAQLKGSKCKMKGHDSYAKMFHRALSQIGQLRRSLYLTS